MTSDQRVRFTAAILKRENGGKKTLGEQCGTNKWFQTQEMPGNWDYLNYKGKENEWVHTGYEKKLNRNLFVVLVAFSILTSTSVFNQSNKKHQYWWLSHSKRLEKIISG